MGFKFLSTMCATCWLCSAMRSPVSCSASLTSRWRSPVRASMVFRSSSMRRSVPSCSSSSCLALRFTASSTSLCSTWTAWSSCTAACVSAMDVPRQSIMRALSLSMSRHMSRRSRVRLAIDWSSEVEPCRARTCSFSSTRRRPHASMPCCIDSRPVKSSRPDSSKPVSDSICSEPSASATCVGSASASARRPRPSAGSLASSCSATPPAAATAGGVPASTAARSSPKAAPTRPMSSFVARSTWSRHAATPCNSSWRCCADAFISAESSSNLAQAPVSEASVLLKRRSKS
mmetsp:Transcript_98307/g.275241  ORF Transcript_98307/g.275241 Transcript_98307/m.275241 type:complete len:289 (-) Transcript_98307:161-1027(-)